jgi:hypothetical protein
VSASAWIHYVCANVECVRADAARVHADALGRADTARVHVDALISP